MATKRQCTACKQVLNLFCFNNKKNGLYGVRSQCKICLAEHRKLRSEKIKQDESLAHKKWYLKNKSRLAILSKAWTVANKDSVYARNKARKRKLYTCTPSWANITAIKTEYKLAQWCSKVMGIPYHVDHIIPIRGKTVCGLHVETNLRVIPAVDNIKKYNLLEAEA